VSAENDRLEALAEERDFLLASLRDLDLELEAGDIDPEDYAALRSGYVARTAEIARELVRGRARGADGRPRNRVRTAVAVLVVAALAAGSGLLVASQSGQRLPGESATGGIDQSTASMLSQARLADISSPAEALVLYNGVLDLEPDNVEALTYRSWLLSRIIPSASDLTDEEKAQVLLSAYADLNRAVEIDPGYADAHCFLGVMEFRVFADAAGAKTALETCRSMNPPQEVSSLLESLIAEVDEALAGA